MKSTLSNFVIIILSLLILTIINASNLNAQAISGSRPKFEPRFIVDMPTAGVISKGNYSINGNLYANGGVAANFTFGVFTNFNLGLSWATNNLIGNANIVNQKLPGINLAYRISDEKLEFPAFTLGVNTQGKSEYIESNDRFEAYSPGVYIVTSKNFNSFMGENALHFGVNYSFEPKPEVRKVNAFVGFEQTLGEYISINAEYNLLTNEVDNDIYKKGKGLLNTSIVISPTSNFSFNLQFRDLLKSRKNNNGISRIIGIELFNKL